MKGGKIKSDAVIEEDRKYRKRHRNLQLHSMFIKRKSVHVKLLQ